MCMYMHTYMYMYIYTYVDVYICTNVYFYIYLFIYLSIHLGHSVCSTWTPLSFFRIHRCLWWQYNEGEHFAMCKGTFMQTQSTKDLDPAEQPEVARYRPCITAT